MEAVTFSIVDEFVQVLSDAAPCGPDLEYAPLYLEFAQACSVKPEAQYGTTITAEVPPDWKNVLRLSRELLAQSRDLRVCIPFTRALMHLQGISGLGIGLRLIEQLLDLHWESVHPQLDPEDDFDPMMRVNTLVTLCEGTTFLRDLYDVDFLSSRAHGRLTLRDIDIATGEIEVAQDTPKVAIGLIEAAFIDATLADLQALHDSLQSACTSVSRIEAIVTDKVGAAQAIDMSVLHKVVVRAHRYVAERLQARVGSPIDGDAASESGASEAAADGTPVRAVGNGIADRDDVLRTLDRIFKYYEEVEPSSPVPLLLMRARRMVTMNFLEIMEDLAPEGLHQVYSVSGTQSAS